MKEFGKFKLITSLQEVAEIQCQVHPSIEDIRNAPGNEGICKGFSVAIYNRRKDAFKIHTGISTLDECFKKIEQIKETYMDGNKLFPKMFPNWWTECGDIYIYETSNHAKPNWRLAGMVIEN